MRECTILVPTPPPSATGYPFPRRRLDSTTTRPEGYRTCHVAVVRALRSLACPSHPHVGPLFRAWAFSSARGPAIPSLGNHAHVRNSGLTCATGGPHTGQLVHTQDTFE